MDHVELKSNLEALNRAWQEFKSTNDSRLKAIEDGKIAQASELNAKQGKIETDLTAALKKQDELMVELKAHQDRLDKIDALRDAGSGAGGGSTAEAKDREHMELFRKWMRAGRMGKAGPELQALADFERAHGKAFSGAAAATGGVAIPTILAREISEQELKLSPVRNLVKVVQAGSRDYNELVLLRQDAATWVAEDSSRSATANVAFRKRTPTFGTIYAYPLASEEIIDDSIVDIAAIVRDTSASQFAKSEGVAVISGNGTAKPTGLFNTTPVTTDDDASPLRAAAALEYVPTDPGVSPSIHIQADSLITLVYTLKSQYRAAASFVCNSLTCAVLRKLKDSYGQYLWQPNLIVGQPPSLLGYPVVTWEDMPDVALNANAIAFGDFRRGYLLVDLHGMRITVDEVTSPGFVKWHVRRRVGGCVLDNDAIKVGRVAAA